MNKKTLGVIIAIIVLAVIAFWFVFLGNKKYEVSFDSVDGSVVEVQKIGKNQFIKKPADPIREGYIFDGWYLDDEEFDFNTPITKNIKLVAKWIPIGSSEDIDNFKVTFDTDGGSFVSSINVQKDETITKPTDPTKEGYKFIAWQLDGEDFDFDTPITKNITLTAKWEKETAEEGETITIPVKSVTLSKTSMSLDVGASSTLTATVYPNNATNKTITWKSSNAAVATVDSKGKVIAKGAGIAKITATAGGKTATCTVTVNKKTITYSIEWVKVQESSIGQYRLFIKSSEGNYVAGKASVTTTAGKTTIDDIPVTGKIYIKSAVANATVNSIN